MIISVISAMMEGRHVLSLKFQDKTGIVMNSLNNLCYSATLCDIRVVGRDGGEVFMHKLILTLAFPALTDILGDHGDDVTVIIVSDYDSDIIEECRQRLYQAGDPDSLGWILGLENKYAIKNEESVDTLEVTLDTLDKISYTAKQRQVEDSVSDLHQAESSGAITLVIPEPSLLQRNSLSKIPCLPLYALEPCKYVLKLLETIPKVFAPPSH